MIEYLTAIEKIPVEGFVLRTLVVGIEIFILGRYLPRRAGGPFSAYDFAFFWMVGGLAASPLYEAKISFIPTFIAAATIYALHYSLSSWATRSRTYGIAHLAFEVDSVAETLQKVLEKGGGVIGELVHAAYEDGRKATLFIPQTLRATSWNCRVGIRKSVNVLYLVISILRGSPSVNPVSCYVI
ncbi:hypothetical protein [Sporomusa acidovorans]|uniref:hypothetical protein n=1 Tax=Sporomusa acidovorans TaxID=112900 RepID=UPI0008835F00|nr:hypothetical protein [Sporomusa acidovorans]OZC19049.1 hypothetical protein SPACI_31350 [Sporomusa acidovorans DSM 3132]SDD74140.1 hypothetical protein SAMN04488499_1003223 [Sporomusa acidovorans]